MKGLLMLAKPGEDDGDDEEKPDAKSGSLSAAKALLKAISANDATATDKALRLHYELCQADEAEDEY